MGNLYQAKTVVEFYSICNKLKTTIRTGWQNWNIKSARVESVAEHIFGMQMLAIAMYSEYEYDIDICKAALMIAVHELGEAVIGDITMFSGISKEEKAKLEKNAVVTILKDLNCKELILSLFDEFEERKTFLSKFVFQCDKLECDLQSKIYDEEKIVDLNNQENNPSFKDERVKQLLKQEKSFSNMWLSFSQSMYEYDNNFLQVSNFVKNNGINN